MNINSNHIFIAFDREMDKSRNWLRDKTFDVCGYSAKQSIERLMQRIVEIALSPYTKAVTTLCTTTGACAIAPGTRINCHRALWESDSGRVRVTLKQWLTNQLEFFQHWILCLLAILSARNYQAHESSAVLAFGIARESLFTNGHDERFVEFCRSGPIEPLRNGKRVIIESTIGTFSSCRDFSYARNPLIELLRTSPIGIFGRLNLLARHLSNFFSYMGAAIRLPLLSLLARDFAYSSISNELGRRGMIHSVVLTTSDYASQPLWMRSLPRCKVHMIWYAQNFKPIVYALDRVESGIPNLRWIRVDKHWVWTHAFGDYLRAMGQETAIEVIGPIVWYVPERASRATDTIVVTIFDVSPYSDDLAFSLGEIPNYNHPDNLFSFIRGIESLKPKLEQAFHLPVSFRLKTKRGYSAWYDKSYFDYLEALNSVGSISLEEPSANLYSLISASHLVIAYPFTSPAYIADFLDVPAIYYDPTGAVAPRDFRDARSLMDFAGSLEDLLSKSILTLSKTFEMHPVG